VNKWNLREIKVAREGKATHARVMLGGFMANGGRATGVGAPNAPPAGKPRITPKLLKPGISGTRGRETLKNWAAGGKKTMQGYRGTKFESRVAKAAEMTQVR